MKASDIGERYGWYAHIMLLAQSNTLNIAQVVELPHREAFYALCYLIDVNR